MRTLSYYALVVFLFSLATSDALLYIKIKGRDLSDEDPGPGQGDADPYVCVRVDNNSNRCTGWVEGNHNPDWGECFTITDSGQDLLLDVWDYDDSSGDDYMGWTGVAMSHMYCMGVGEEARVKLQGYSGYLLVSRQKSC